MSVAIRKADTLPGWEGELPVLETYRNWPSGETTGPYGPGSVAATGDPGTGVSRPESRSIANPETLPGLAGLVLASLAT